MANEKQGTKPTTKFEEMTSVEQLEAFNKLTEEHANLAKQLAEANANLETATELNDDLQKQLAKAELSKGSIYPVVSLKNKQYQVIIPQFNYKKSVVKATELQDDSEMLEELVTIGFAGIVPMGEQE